MIERYVAPVRLLLSTLPEIARESAFALKGGTAINLFYRDMPRLSVDIDLTYLPVGDRGSSLRDIDEAFDRIAMAIAARSPRIEARRIAGGGESETWYDEEFAGMTREAVSGDALVEVRRRLHADIAERLKGDVAAFLLSLHDAEPDFGLIGLPEAAGLPAVRWKLVNLERLKKINPGKHAVQRDALESLFR